MISVERAIAIFWPLKVCIYCTRRKTLTMISILIAIMSVVNLPVFSASDIVKRHTGYQCYLLGYVDSQSEAIYILLYSLLYSIIPFCIILILNTLTVKKIYSQEKFRVQHQTSQRGKPGRSTSMTVTMFAVCIVFVLTTLPGQVLSLNRAVTRLRGMDLQLGNNIFVLTLYKLDSVNHSVNFILYCVTGSVFRQTLVRLFTCRKRRISRRYTAEQFITAEQGV